MSGSNLHGWAAIRRDSPNSGDVLARHQCRLGTPPAAPDQTQCRGMDRRVPPSDMFLSSTTILELETCALLLKRRDDRQGRLIQQWIEDRVLPAFTERILAVDATVARRCAALHVPDPRPFRDSLIAATALVHGLTVVARNRADFEPMAVAVLNPWA